MEVSDPTPTKVGAAAASYSDFQGEEASPAAVVIEDGTVSEMSTVAESADGFAKAPGHQAPVAAGRGGGSDPSPCPAASAMLAVIGESGSSRNLKNILGGGSSRNLKNVLGGEDKDDVEKAKDEAEKKAEKDEDRYVYSYVTYVSGT